MIKELNQKIKKRELTCLDLCKKYLDKIKKDNNRLNVFLEFYEEEALLNAKKVDEKVKKEEAISLLEGIPYALKDNMAVKGKIMSSASKMLENYKSPYNSTVVKKIKDKNALYLGRTNMDEFAMGASTENSAFGVTKNPHDETCVSGGSSGGSAASVAADMVTWSLGSDTGGSIRQPAGFCGVVGFKPTYGRVSRYGLSAMASSYDQIGPITKTVEDAAIVFDAICGNDVLDNTTVSRKDEGSFYKNLNTDLKGKKIGIVKSFFMNGLDGDVEKIVKDKAAWAKDQGAELVDIELPLFNHSLAVYYLMQPSEVSSNLARIDGIRYGFNESKIEKSKSKNILDVYKYSRAVALGPEVKRRIILGTYALSAGYYDAYYKKAQKVRELIKKELAEAFQKVDVILSPTSPTPAFKIGDKSEDPLAMYLADIYTVTANVAMIPAITIPAGFSEKEGSKLPVGIQLMGKWWDEQNLLNIASAFDKD